MIPIERRFQDYLLAYVRCGGEMHVDYDHPSIAEQHWGVTGEYGYDKRDILFNRFGPENVDMGLIVLRDGKRIEFGGWSGSMGIPQTPEMRDVVRPITESLITEAHPGFVVCHIPDLARPRY